LDFFESFFLFWTFLCPFFSFFFFFSLRCTTRNVLIYDVYGITFDQKVTKSVYL
jgi:hypothetical protein